MEDQQARGGLFDREGAGLQVDHYHPRRIALGIVRSIGQRLLVCIWDPDASLVATIFPAPPFELLYDPHLYHLHTLSRPGSQKTPTLLLQIIARVVISAIFSVQYTFFRRLLVCNMLTYP